MFIESVMPSNHLFLCCPLLLLPSIFPSIKFFSNESVLHIRWPKYWSFSFSISSAAAATAAKWPQSCLTLCDPTDGSPPGSPIPGILQARILEWVAISFSTAWKRKVKVKSLSRVRLLATPWTAAYQAPLSMDFPGKSTGVGCHCLLCLKCKLFLKYYGKIKCPLLLMPKYNSASQDI